MSKGNTIKKKFL